MESADQVGGIGTNRIEKIRDFAKSEGIKKIGIAHCKTFTKEADVIKRFLDEDFEVFAIDCKYGSLKGEELFSGGGEKILCNPAGQAAFLNEAKTELNVAVGLCVGHDIVFNEKSEAPVTSFITKDFQTKHNTDRVMEDISQKLA